MVVLKIFVCLGTQDKPFKRLLDLLEKADIEADIVVQSGYTSFESKKMKCSAYFSPEEFKAKLQWADIIISHGGVGTIMQALKLGKKIIVIPRLACYKEHQNDHQVQICENFAKRGYVLYWQQDENLNMVLKRSENFKPSNFISNQNVFLTKLKSYLDREV